MEAEKGEKARMLRGKAQDGEIFRVVLAHDRNPGHSGGLGPGDDGLAVSVEIGTGQVGVAVNHGPSRFCYFRQPLIC